MNERHKLAEAEFFLSEMESIRNRPDAFQHFLSAFLSAARSVLQYALEEAKQKPGGQQWYDKQVSADAVLKLFKDKRDINIHVMPVNVARSIAATDTANISISESLLVVITRADGAVEKKEIVSEPAISSISNSESSIAEHFRFSDWLGPEDVLTLSRTYLSQLQSFADSGIRAGYILG